MARAGESHFLQEWFKYPHSSLEIEFHIFISYTCFLFLELKISKWNKKRGEFGAPVSTTATAYNGRPNALLIEVARHLPFIFFRKKNVVNSGRLLVGRNKSDHDF